MLRQQLENQPPEDRLTQEEAEAVANLYAERERQRTLEAERIAQMPKVDDVADILGTSPDDVEALLETVRTKGYTKPKPKEAEVEESRFPKKEINWSLHTIYAILILVAIAITWANVPRFNQPAAQNQPISGSMGHMLRYDPLAGGYMREPTFGRPFKDTYVVDRSVQAPPPGIKVSSLGSLGMMIITGPPGEMKAGPTSVAELKKSIQSLLKYEEGLMKVEIQVPIASYSKVPMYESNYSPNGIMQPRFLGWHLVNISNGVTSTDVYLPDARFATSKAEYDAEMQKRLEWAVDKKFVPGVAPGLLKPHSQKINLKTQLPKGLSVMIYDEKDTIWADTGDFQPDPKMNPEQVEKQLKAAFLELMTAVSTKKLLNRPDYAASGQHAWNVPVKVVVPGKDIDGWLNVKLANGKVVPGNEIDQPFDSTIKRTIDSLKQVNNIREIGTMKVGQDAQGNQHITTSKPKM